MQSSSRRRELKQAPLLSELSPGQWNRAITFGPSETGTFAQLSPQDQELPFILV